MNEYRRGTIEIVRVKWIDSNSLGGWHSIVSALRFAENELFQCESVGYLIYENKAKVVLAMSTYFGKDDDPEIVDDFSDLLTIPKFAIISKEKLDD